MFKMTQRKGEETHLAYWIWSSNVDILCTLYFSHSNYMSSSSLSFSLVYSAPSLSCLMLLYHISSSLSHISYPVIVSPISFIHLFCLRFLSYSYYSFPISLLTRLREITTLKITNKKLKLFARKFVEHHGIILWHFQKYLCNAHFIIYLGLCL